MRRMLKYQMFSTVDSTVIELPLHADIKHVGVQGETGLVMLWAEVHQDIVVNEPRTFKVFTTGETIPDSWVHRGTFIVPNALGRNNDFVGHVYEDCTNADLFEEELLNVAAESELHHHSL